MLFGTVIKLVQVVAIFTATTKPKHSANTTIDGNTITLPGSYTATSAGEATPSPTLPSITTTSSSIGTILAPAATSPTFPTCTSVDDIRLYLATVLRKASDMAEEATDRVLKDEFFLLIDRLLICHSGVMVLRRDVSLSYHRFLEVCRTNVGQNAPLTAEDTDNYLSLLRSAQKVDDRLQQLVARGA
jgi:hypothetical protein